MKVRKFSLSLFLIIICFSNIRSAEFFTDKGSMWLGGGFTFSMIGYKDDRVHLITAMPFFRYFPINFLGIGWRLEWVRISKDYYNANALINQFGGGLDITLAYGKNPHIKPYLLLGLKFDRYYYRYDYHYPPKEKDNGNGFTLPIEAGLILSINGKIGLQIESGFHMKYYDNDEKVTNVFQISIGFCGIGKKASVSLLHNIPIFYVLNVYNI